MNPRAVLEFLRHHRLAVQASVSAEGGPQAAVVGFAITDQFEIVFDTLESTRKAGFVDAASAMPRDSWLTALTGANRQIRAR